MYTDTDATTSSMHLRNFSRCINAYVNDPLSQHDDVYMKLFDLSLDGKAGDWYNNFATLSDFKTSFTNKFGEKKEPRHQLASLTNIKKKDTETMDEFNTRFTELSKAIPTAYAPTAPTILVYYIEALSGKMQYQIRDKEPANLVQAQEMAIKIDLNM